MFKLRQGVKSNWGNELTAEDVQLDLGPQVRASTALGAVLYQRDRPQAGRTAIKVEGSMLSPSTSTKPNPLLLKIQANLYCPIYDATKCKEVGGADDPWAREVHRERKRRLWPVPADS